MVPNRAGSTWIRLLHVESAQDAVQPAKARLPMIVQVLVQKVLSSNWNGTHGLMIGAASWQQLFHSAGDKMSGSFCFAMVER